MPRYLDTARLLTADSIKEDNLACRSYINDAQDSFVIVSTGKPGHILYPGIEMSRYRPIQDAMMFGDISAAEAHLNDVRDTAWWFNIFNGPNEDGEPDVELWGKPWGNDMKVVALSDAAIDRKAFNDYRLDLIETC